MLGLTLIVAAAALAGVPQKTADDIPAQIDPTRLKALENGLRGAYLGRVQPEPNWLRAPSTQRMKPQRTIVNRGADASGSHCGHIRVVPVDPKIDPGMLLKVPKLEQPIDRMPIMKGMPPCPADLK